MRAAATRIADIALVRGVARIDFLLAGSELYVNEINTIPGALSWYLWAAGGVPFATFLTSHRRCERRSGRSWSTKGPTLCPPRRLHRGTLADSGSRRAAPPANLRESSNSSRTRPLGR